MKEEEVISGLKLQDEEDFAGQEEDEAFQPEELCAMAVGRPCSSECEQLSMEETGWCCGEVEGKGRERTMVEWWDGAKVQNKCLINQIAWEGTQLPLVQNPRGVKAVRSSLLLCDYVLLL